MLVYIRENEIGRANFVDAVVQTSFISVQVKNTETGEFITFGHTCLGVKEKHVKRALMIIFDKINQIENDHRYTLDQEYVGEIANYIEEKAKEWF